MRADLDQLQLAQQLLARQGSTHAVAMRDYVRSHASIDGGDLGAILSALAPLNALIVEIGAGVFDTTRALAEHSAANLGTTIDRYVAEDRATHERFAAVVTSLGGTPSPYADPRANPPVLGAAGSAAPSDYGAREQWILPEAIETGSEIGEQVGGFPGAVVDRITSGFGASGVAERNDASSYLVTPQATKSEIENMRWSAGPIVGGVDWVIEQFVGVSLLEDVIMKPFAGDWTAIEEASLAWAHLGSASFAMGENFTGLPDQTLSWEGPAAEAFRAAMAAFGAALVALRSACDTVSGALGSVVTVSKAAAAAIGFCISQIVKHALVLAAEAAVPVAGWIAAAVHVVVIVYDIISYLKLIYSICEAILDMIYAAVESRLALLDTALVVQDLVQYLGGAGARGVRAVTA